MGLAMSVPQLLIILAIGASDGRAQRSDIAQDAQRIFSQVMSPYCPGKVLADCTSSSAAELKAALGEARIPIFYLALSPSIFSSSLSPSKMSRSISRRRERISPGGSCSTPSCSISR